MVHWIRLCATPLFALVFAEGAAIADDLRVVIEGEWTEEAVLSPDYLDTYGISPTGNDINGAFEVDLVLPEDHQLDDLGEAGSWILREWRTLLGEPAGHLVAARSTPIEPLTSSLPTTGLAEVTLYWSVVLAVAEDPEEWGNGLSSGVGFLALIEICNSNCATERIYSTVEFGGLVYDIDGSAGDRQSDEYNDLGVPNDGDLSTGKAPIVVLRYFEVLSIRVVPEPYTAVLVGMALCVRTSRRRFLSLR